MKRQMYCDGYNIGYARLAAAIIADGQKHNDQAFLNSDWCNLLVEFCKLVNDIQRHGYNDSVHLPKRKTYRSSD